MPVFVLMSSRNSMQGYIITNLINGKRYVGKTTKTLARRWGNHLSYAKGGGQTYLAKAIRKYGAENFTIDPLSPARYDLTKESDLNEWECLMIRLIGTKVPNGYNLTDGGESGFSGGHHSEDARRRIGEASHNIHQRRTHCPNGHERTPENLNKRRNCRICQQISNARHYRKVTSNAV